MKTKQSFRKQFFAGALVAFFATIVLMSCKKDDDVNTQHMFNISGSANASQVFPAITDTAGTGTITGTYDSTTKVLNYTTTWTGLSAAPTTGGFYNGASGTAGLAVATPWTFDSTATTTGTRTGNLTLTAEQATQLTSGGWYFTYGTAANPGGAIRGQITATQQ